MRDKKKWRIFRHNQVRFSFCYFSWKYSEQGYFHIWFITTYLDHNSYKTKESFNLQSTLASSFVRNFRSNGIKWQSPPQGCTFAYDLNYHLFVFSAIFKRSFVGKGIRYILKKNSEKCGLYSLFQFEQLCQITVLQTFKTAIVIFVICFGW